MPIIEMLDFDNLKFSHIRCLHLSISGYVNKLGNDYCLERNADGCFFLMHSQPIKSDLG